MAKPARLRIINNVALVQLDAAPDNALDAAMRARLWDVFQRIAAEPAITAVVLLATGRNFSTGLDLAELDGPGIAPSIAALCALIEACKVPVVAGLHGAVLGAGAELAMAAHYRIAEKAAVIGLPDLTLGLVPSGGGTQRLPRLVGPRHALNMILGGRPIRAETAAGIGLIDTVVEDDVAYAALVLAQRVSRPRPTAARRNRLADGAAYLGEIDERRRAVAATGRFAAERAVACVGAALLLPFDAGQSLETDAFARCLAHPQSKALRHVTLAERGISPDLMQRGKDGYSVTDPHGTVVVTALDQAWQRALTALQAKGFSQSQIDRAHVDDGFLRGPFGGRDGNAGAQGAEIRSRVLAALVAEGARLVADGHVARASDIDVLAVHGLGYPRQRGGPMMAGKLAGLLPLSTRMKHWATEDPVWEPPQLLLRAALMADGFEAVTA